MTRPTGEDEMSDMTDERAGVGGLVSEMREASKSWRHGAHPMVTCEIAAEWADRLESLAAAPQPPAEAQAQGGGERKPDGFHYRYRDPYGGEGTIIRNNSGQEVNGSWPIEAVPYWYSAPPSAPVGVEAVRALKAKYQQHIDADHFPYHFWRDLESALAQQPAAHPDDAAVDAFAGAMKEKLAAARAKGRGGWDGDEPGMQQRLSNMLRAHVEKGDPRDVANFAMFLHQRGEAILPAQQPAAVDGAMVPVAEVVHGAGYSHVKWNTEGTWGMHALRHGAKLYAETKEMERVYLREQNALAAQPGGSDNDR